MQVSWNTIECIATSKGIDLWILVPLGQGINRLLTKRQMPPAKWSDALTKVFGTDSWQMEFYTTNIELTLFGDEERILKDAEFGKIVAFFVSRLKTIFPGVVEKPMLLRNSKNTPLYLLCFAASNAKGAGPAIRIATYLTK